MSSAAEPSFVPREPLPTRLKTQWKRFGAWWSRRWKEARPGREARTGALCAMLVTVLAAAITGGYYLHSGFGLWIDLGFALAIAAVGIPIVALLAALVLTILRKLPRLASGLLFATCVYIALLWPPPLGFYVAILLALVEGFLGAAVATILFGHFGEAALSKKIITVTLGVVCIAANIAIAVFFLSDGTGKDILRFQETAASAPPALTAPNPSQPGTYPVKFMTYGSGADIRRPEYAQAVAIKTPAVDGSLFFKEFKGWKANLRRRYWGFGMDKLPLNARVWYPAGPGPFPLALIVHGNHGMADFSDPGYAYLGELLASRGFILASIDENFLNSGLFHDPPKQQAVRGWMLLEHLKLWRAWNETPGNPFYRKVDVDNVALMGHSRGGEAVATAALFNGLSYYPDDANIKFHYRYPIKSLVAIAPADGQYKPAGQWRYVDNVNYLTLQGANDADVSSFMGSRQWDHVRYTKPGPWFKSEIYIYRANHGQFNSVWGRTDYGGPLNWFLNLKPLISGDEQRRIAKIYIAAFLEATLHNRREYLPLFHDYRTIRGWLPQTYYMSRYQDASYKLVSDFNEDADVTTATVPGGRIDAQNMSVWREGRIPYRQGDRDYNGVFLGWNRKGQKTVPVYSISLPDEAARSWNLGPRSVLSMSLAVTDEKAPPPGQKPEQDTKDAKTEPEPTDFTVEIGTADGVAARLPLSRFGTLPPPFKVRFTKLAQMDSAAYKKASEPIFETIEMPLAAFAEQSKGFDPARIKTIRLRFDRTESRVVILSEIGFDGGEQ